jgi:hypothetical protein
MKREDRVAYGTALLAFVIFMAVMASLLFGGCDHDTTYVRTVDTIYCAWDGNLFICP